MVGSKGPVLDAVGDGGGLQRRPGIFRGTKFSQSLGTKEGSFDTTMEGSSGIDATTMGCLKNSEPGTGVSLQHTPLPVDEGSANGLAGWTERQAQTYGTLLRV